MNNIPTVKEYFESKSVIWHTETANGTDYAVIDFPDVIKITLELIKLHVEVALKTASENATCEIDNDMIHKLFILNAYPLENIK